MAGDRLRIAEGSAAALGSAEKTGCCRDLAKASPTIAVPSALRRRCLWASPTAEDGSRLSDELWGGAGRWRRTPRRRPDGDGKVHAGTPGFGRAGSWWPSSDTLTPCCRWRCRTPWTATRASGRGLRPHAAPRVQAGIIGDVPYKVTFFEHRRASLWLWPEPRYQRHKELNSPCRAAIYHTALKQDTMGGPEDDFCTTTQLAWACQFRVNKQRLATLNFAGP